MIRQRPPAMRHHDELCQRPLVICGENVRDLLIGPGDFGHLIFGDSREVERQNNPMQPSPQRAALSSSPPVYSKTFGAPVTRSYAAIRTLLTKWERLGRPEPCV